MINGNIFRRAKLILQAKPFLERTDEEQSVIDTAILPLLLLRRFNKTRLVDGLDFLAGGEDHGKQKGS